MLSWKNIAVAGALAVGFSTPALAQRTGMGAVNAGLAGQSSILADDTYRPGWGVKGHVGWARPLAGRVVGDLGVQGAYTNYRIESDAVGSDLNEGAVSLRGLVGPNTTFFKPKVGGHAGYARLEDEDYLDLGVDVKANFRVSPRFDVMASVLPTWYMNQDRSEYLTRLALGVEWSPGV